MGQKDERGEGRFTSGCLSETDLHLHIVSVETFTFTRTLIIFVWSI